MKKVTFSLLLSMISLFAFAQVQEGVKTMSKGQNNGFSILLKKTNKDDVEKAWKKYIKDYDGKVKFNKKSKETFSDNAEIKEMSNNTVDIYAAVTKQGEDTNLTVWFDLGGAFLNSQMHGEKTAVAEKILTDFAATVSTAAIEDAIKEQEKVVKKLENKLDDAKDEEKDAKKEIEKCKEKIAEAEKTIENAAKAQGEVKGEIEKEKQVLEELQKKLKRVKG